MIYRCQHCDEQVRDIESRAARETCYVSPNGRHKWVETVPEGREERFEGFPSMESVYGE